MGTVRTPNAKSMSLDRPPMRVELSLLPFSFPGVVVSHDLADFLSISRLKDEEARHLASNAAEEKRPCLEGPAIHGTLPEGCSTHLIAPPPQKPRP
jgi:hypothetical protein